MLTTVYDGGAVANEERDVDRTLIKRGDRQLAAFVTAGPPESPVVVLECGLGNDHYCWDRVVPLLAEHATVVTYDRAGYGVSPATSEVRSLGNLAADLVAVIEQTSAGRPVVVVGHSLGGRIARAAAPSIPHEQLRGLVLLEGAPDGIVADKPELDRAQRRVVKTIPFVGRTPLLRLGPVQRQLATRAGYDDVGSEGFQSILGNMRRPSFGRALVQEWASMHDEIVVHRTDVPAIELVAMGWEKWSQRRRRRTNTSPDELIAYIEKHFLGLYPDGDLRRIAGTGHGIQWDRADAVAEAVIDLVRA